jgi:FMN phosphatase YigB (HAD superfamily)
LFSCFGTSNPGAFAAAGLAAVDKSLDVIFDAVLSIGAVGIYKPHPRGFVRPLRRTRRGDLLSILE